MNKLFVFLLVALLFIVPTVFGAGVCKLNKENYLPGGNPLFSCSCSLPNEENVDGFVVWRYSNGTIFQNSSLNTNSCRTSFATTSYTFPSNFGNNTGNVTFETGNANWANANDIINDTFNVSGPSVFDCLIVNIKAKSVSPGEVGVVSFEVKDAVTSGPLIHSSCVLSVYDVNDFPIFLDQNEVTGSDETLTQNLGEAYFIHEFKESFWMPNTTYKAEIRCHCLNFSDLPNSICFNENTGETAGFKTCRITGPLITGANDLRDSGSKDRTAGAVIIAFMSGLAILIFCLPFLFKTFVNNEFSNLIIKKSCWIISVFILVWISGVLAHLSNISNLGLQKEMFTLMEVIGWTGYVMIIYLVTSTLLDVKNLYKTRKDESRGL